MSGFYAPQGRSLRLQPSNKNLMRDLRSFTFKERQITNLEMETAGIYGLSALLGHRAVSISCILANRATGEFSAQPENAMQDLIAYCLEKICY